MSLWSRRTRPPVVEELQQVSAGTELVPRQRSATTGLDLALRKAHEAQVIGDPLALWSLLSEEHPDATAGQHPLAVVLATHVGLTGSPRALLFATSSHLHAVDELCQLVSWDYGALQSIGRLAGGYPRLQVVALRDPGRGRLVIGTYELAPNRDTGVFWHDLQDAVQAARPDLSPHSAGAYGGLGVPPEPAH
jgi:hypothetical protein